MKLTLDRCDLRPEFENISFRMSKFEHFNKDAQRAIVAVGRAVFRDDNNYNAIFAPKDRECALAMNDFDEITTEERSKR